MKKILLLFTCFCIALTAGATINIKDGGKYRFVCVNYNTGNMVLGANHNVAPYVYYYTTLTTASDDAWWVVKTDGNGYTISNAQSGEYLIYKEGRTTNSNGEYTAKGIQLATSVSDDNGRWTLTENEQGSIIIENVGTPGQYFNVRTDGTYLVGTYADATTANGFFILYDEDGNSVVKVEDGGGSTEYQGSAGITSDGEYWETTGLATPFVVTTNTSNPVLYRIVNVRSGYNVTASSSILAESTTEYTQFYFVESGSGLQVYTKDGQYVSTSYYTYQQNSNGLTLSNGTSTSGSNIWKIGFYEDSDYPGYTFCKLDNLPSSSSTGGGWGGGWGGGSWNSQSSYLYWNDYALSSSRAVGLYDLDGGCTFTFYSSDTRHRDYLLQQGIDFTGKASQSMSAYVDTLFIGGKGLVYDSHDKVYYCPLPETAREGNLTTTLSVKWTNADSTYVVKIGDNTPDAEGNLVIEGVKCSEAYTIALLKADGDTVSTAKLYFTYLPIVEITVPSCNGSYYTAGKLRVVDPDTEGDDLTYPANFKYRGASAQNYAKKSFAVKLKDEEGNSVDREYFGLRNDNNWILDAMAIDKACMRNRVSFDLWNDFATKPYQRREGWEKKAKSGTRGRFVEAFYNGRYQGIYCMTEKIDRKQLRLKKLTAATETSADTIHGTLYKSTQWGYEVFMGHYSDQSYYPKTAPASYNNDNKSETWQNYEIKYPDWEEEKIDWGPLWNAVNFVATSSDTDFDTNLKDWFDYPVLRDYYLFIELMLASDNHGKNMFFFNYDQQGTKYAKMIGIAPWDLDGTWGRRWDGSSSYTSADQDFTTFLNSYEHGTHTLFYRLAKSTTWDWENDLKERYAELRPDEFSEDALVKRFTEYADLFADSNADSREQKRWSSLHSNIGNDVKYIKTWIASRLAYLDDQYSYVAPEPEPEPKPDGISTPVSENDYVGATGGHGTISIHVTHPMSVNIYTIGGALVRTVSLTQSVTTLEGFNAGMYIVGGKKVFVK